MNKEKLLLLLLSAGLISPTIALTPKAIALVSGDRPVLTQRIAPAEGSPEAVSRSAPFLARNNETAAASHNESDQDVEVEVVTATPDGFEPAVITRQQGPFVLAVHNRSGEGELVLRLFRAQGEQLHEARLRSGRRSHHQRVDLPPGEYIVSEAGHPAWSCRITLTR